MSSLMSRITALEAEVKSLRSVPPLAVFMESLKAATAEEIKAWMDVCNEVSSKYLHTEVLAESAESAKPVAAESKSEKKKRAPTNPTGPKEWNTFVRATWHEMAASAGVLYESDETFKKAAAKAGVSYQMALQEAKARKAVMEGKVKPVAKTSLEAKAPAKAVPAPLKIALPPVTPATSETSETSETPESEPDYSAQLENGWIKIQTDDGEGWHDPTDNIVYDLSGDEPIGMYDVVMKSFVANE